MSGFGHEGLFDHFHLSGFGHEGRVRQPLSFFVNVSPHASEIEWSPKQISPLRGLSRQRLLLSGPRPCAALAAAAFITLLASISFQEVEHILK